MTYLYLYWCFGFFWTFTSLGQALLLPVPKNYALHPVWKLTLLFCVFTLSIWPIDVIAKIDGDIQRL